METLDDLMHTLTHLTIDQMLDLIKKSGNTTNRRFRATGPLGSLEGVVLDVYLQIIRFDTDGGFVLAKEFRFANDITWELI